MNTTGSENHESTNQTSSAFSDLFNSATFINRIDVPCDHETDLFHAKSDQGSDRDTSETIGLAESRSMDRRAIGRRESGDCQANMEI